MISPCVTCIALKLGPTDMPHKDVGDAGNILGHVLSPRKKGAALWKGEWQAPVFAPDADLAASRRAGSIYRPRRGHSYQRNPSMRCEL